MGRSSTLKLLLLPPRLSSSPAVPLFAPLFPQRRSFSSQFATILCFWWASLSPLTLWCGRVLSILRKPLIVLTVTSHSCRPLVCADGWSFFARLTCAHHMQAWLEEDVAGVNQFVIWIKKIGECEGSRARLCDSSGYLLLPSQSQCVPNGPKDPLNSDASRRKRREATLPST